MSRYINCFLPMTSEVLSTRVVAYVGKNELKDTSDFDDIALNSIIETMSNVVSELALLSPSGGFNEDITNKFLKDINLKLSKENKALLVQDLNDCWRETGYDEYVTAHEQSEHIPQLHVEVLKKGLSSISWQGFTKEDAKAMFLIVNNHEPSDERAQSIADGFNEDLVPFRFLAKE